MQRLAERRTARQAHAQDAAGYPRGQRDRRRAGAHALGPLEDLGRAQAAAAALPRDPGIQEVLGAVATDARRTAAAHHALDDAALEFGGSLSGEHGGGCLKDVGKQLGKDEHALMLAVRRVFDPKGILNPGKGY